MTVLVSRHPFSVMLSENDGSSVISEIYLHDPYSSNSDTIPQYEVVNLAPEDDFSADEMSSSTSGSISDSIEDILRNFKALGITIQTSLNLFKYLYNFPDIAGLARDVSNLVYRHFDSSAKLFLEVRDSDDPDSEYLALVIRVPEYNDGVMERIEQIRESYYSLLDDMAGWFLFTTDFQSPR
jgi:hypothetical protein